METKEGTLRFLEALDVLNKKNPCEAECLQAALSENVDDVSYVMKVDKDDIIYFVRDIRNYQSHDDSPIWNYLILNSYYLSKFINEIEKTPEEVEFSLSQKKDLRAIFKNFITIGIKYNLLKNLPAAKPCKSLSFYEEEDFVSRGYNRLIFTTHALILFIKSEKLKTILLPFFDTLLNAIYQIIYCPLAKPGTIQNGFEMTKEKMNLLVQDKSFFQKHFEELNTFLNKETLITSTMLLLRSIDCNYRTQKSWLVRAININLTKIIKSKNGLEELATTLLNLDYGVNDTSKTWRSIDIIVKLLVSLKKADDFKESILVQIIHLLKGKGDLREPFEDIFVACVKTISQENFEEGLQTLIKTILLGPLSNLNTTGDITGYCKETVRIIHKAFIRGSPNYQNLPPCDLKPVVVILIQLANVTMNCENTLGELNLQLKELLYYFFKECKEELYDAIISYEVNGIIPCNHTFSVEENTIFVTIGQNADLINEILLFVSSDLIAVVDLCIYGFKTLTEKKDDLDSTTNLKRRQNAGKVIQSCLRCKDMQTVIMTKPGKLLSYFHILIDDFIKGKVHKSKRYCQDLDFLFIILILLESILCNSPYIDIQQFIDLLDKLELIKIQTNKRELRERVSSLIILINSRKNGKESTKVAMKEAMDETENWSEFRKAVSEVMDPLIPIKAHGLFRLTQLIEQDDPNTAGKSFFLANLFQQQLLDTDSFIYSHAINGLAALGKTYPELVIFKLTEEYADLDETEDSDDNMKFRLKVGEVLVHVIKSLGPVAARFKSELVNTYFVLCKDDNPWMRASALVYLGTICEAVGAALSPIMIEIIISVYNIMTKDKELVARKAAVVALGGIFRGLGEETPRLFIKEIPSMKIWKTLNDLYRNNEDESMRLQAQETLDDLNRTIYQYIEKYTHKDPVLIQFLRDSFE